MLFISDYLDIFILFYFLMCLRIYTSLKDWIKTFDDNMSFESAYLYLHSFRNKELIYLYFKTLFIYYDGLNYLCSFTIFYIMYKCEYYSQYLTNTGWNKYLFSILLQISFENYFVEYIVTSLLMTNDHRICLEQSGQYVFGLIAIDICRCLPPDRT